MAKHENFNDVKAMLAEGDDDFSLSLYQGEYLLKYGANAPLPNDDVTTNIVAIVNDDDTDAIVAGMHAYVTGDAAAIDKYSV